MKKISYSAWKKYHDCPMYYKLHYIDRLRTSGTSSPLVFGSAVDDALNEFLENKKDPIKVFREVFKFEDLQDVEWDSKDYDASLFTVDQLDSIESQTWEYKCWASMRIKGRLLIKAWIEQIFPKIGNVIAVQKTIAGDNPGILDILAMTELGVTVIDNKTSSRLYKWDAVLYDSQLAFYAYREGVDNAAFAVMLKNIGKGKVCEKCGKAPKSNRSQSCDHGVKRCGGPFKVTPIPVVQFLLNKVPPRNKDLIAKSIEDTEALIHMGLFPRNLTKCDFMYGKPCRYKDYCWKGNSAGLTKKKEKV